MKNGQAIKQDFVILSKSQDQQTILITKQQEECCFELPALAEEVETSELRNDKHSVIWFFGQLFTGAEMILERHNGADFAEVDVLDSNTYGTFSAFGFFTNKFGEKAIGYQLNWRAVLLAWGEGDYRIKVEATPEIGAAFEDYSFNFCLKKYTEPRADMTTRISWNRNGQFGDIAQDERNNDFGTLNWFNQIRLPSSFFGRPTNDQEKKFTKYAGGNEIWTTDIRVEKYLWLGYSYPAFMHNYLSRNVTAGDDITITDYNLTNPNQFVNKKVVYESNYAPDWLDDVDKANIELTFKQEFQNLVKKRD